jgi:GDP-mannose 6-dehydrogenase
VKVAVFGLGYVGSVTAAALARDGHDVVGVDVAAPKIEAIRAGRSPVLEPGVDDIIANAVAAGRLRATPARSDRS